MAGAGGFDFEDMEIEGNLQKYVRMVQKGLLKEIDNQAVLMAYGIDVTQVTTTNSTVQTAAAAAAVDAEALPPISDNIVDHLQPQLVITTVN